MKRFAFRSLAAPLTILLALTGAACTNADSLSGGTTPGDAVKAAVAARTPEDPDLIWTPSSVVLLYKEIAPSVYTVYPDDAPAKNAAGIPVATSGASARSTRDRERMIQAGAQPVSWVSVICELQRDWGRAETRDDFSRILFSVEGN